MRLRLKEPMDGSSLIFCGIEFQIVGAANLKALRPTALAVKGTCNRLSEAERRGLGGLLRLISDERYVHHVSIKMCHFFFSFALYLSNIKQL